MAKEERDTSTLVPPVAPACSSTGCPKPVHSRGLCQAHYRLLKKYGAPDKLPPELYKKPGPKPDPSRPRSRHSPKRLAEGTIRKYVKLGEYCPQGHFMDEDNAYIYHRSSGIQYRCRECYKQWYREHGRFQRIAKYGYSPEGFMPRGVQRRW